MSIKTTNPATGQLLQQYPTMHWEEVDQIIHHTAKAQQTWTQTDLTKRIQAVQTLTKQLRTQSESFATLITQEMGKPIAQARGEIEKCALLCEHYTEHATEYLQPQPVLTEKQKSYRCFEPLGTIFAIMPWNFPFWQVLRFSVPNLIAGNAGILKHAPNCTGTALAIEQLFIEASFPEHLFRSIVIDIDLAKAVIHHPLVAGVTLTGSGKAGAAVASEAGRALKKVVLELGGSDPYIILPDADIDHAVEQCVLSRFNNAGQVCIAAKRIIVVKEIADAFINKLKVRATQYSCGDPMLADTMMGPLAREDLRTTLHQQVQDSISKGAHCQLGGHMLEQAGYFYAPTLLTNVKPGMPAYDEELFGPVLCVLIAQDEAEAIRIANDTPYGLGAAVFTKDITKGERIAQEQLHAGTCCVNSLVTSDPRLPFGGVKNSGFGRELAAEGIHEWMNIKTVVVA